MIGVMEIEQSLEGTVAFAKAIADETRQQIMELCCCTAMSVNELVEQMGVTQPTVSHHLAILRQAGLVTAERQGKQILYQINHATIAENCCQVAYTFAPSVEVVVRSLPQEAGDT
jgi:DNA-binding transcriptional ArsR family regulator